MTATASSQYHLPTTHKVANSYDELSDGGLASSPPRALCDPLRMDDPVPRQAGRSLVPPVMRPQERELVEWVANASPGDRIPEPWSYAHSPRRSIILTLINLKVMAVPEPGADPQVVVEQASAAARAWLKAHPEEPGEDQADGGGFGR